MKSSDPERSVNQGDGAEPTPPQSSQSGSDESLPSTSTGVTRGLMDSPIGLETKKLLRRRHRARFGTYDRDDPTYQPPKSVKNWVDNMFPLIEISDDEEESEDE